MIGVGNTKDGRVTIHNYGKWTAARFHSFVKGVLRLGSQKWPPKNEVKKKARTRRGFYQCNSCNKEVPASLPPLPGNKRRINNAVVDHVNPIIDPKKGFETWDKVVERMFCEEDGLQVLCHECHTIKTKEEREIAKERRSNQHL